MAHVFRKGSGFRVVRVLVVMGAVVAPSWAYAYCSSYGASPGYYDQCMRNEEEARESQEYIQDQNARVQERMEQQQEQWMYDRSQQGDE